MKKKARILLLIFWVVAIFVLTGYPGLETPTIKDFPIDKLYHFLIAFILGILEYRILKTSLFFIIGAGVILLAELQQFFIPGRSFDIVDICFSMLGLVISYALFNGRSIVKNALSKT